MARRLDARLAGRRRLKIAVVLGPGAIFCVEKPNSIETVVRTLARYSADRDDLTIYCDAGAPDRGELKTQAVAPGLGRTGRIIRALRRDRPDFIELHQHGPSSARIARAFPDIPNSLYRHNQASGGTNALDRLRYARRFRAFDAHVFVSDYLRAAFASSFPRMADRGFTIHNPIDADLWSAPVDGRGPVIAFTGRAAPEKGFDLICEALETVLDRHPDWRADLLVIDWHAHAEWAQKHADRLSRFGARASIRKQQPWAVVRDTLQAASIALTPSVFADPFPLAALEAHAAGAAVVSSGRGGLREGSGPHATYVEPLDAASLAREIEGLIVDPESRLAMAQSGQAHVQTEHTPQRRAAQLDALRHRLIQAKKARAPV